MGDIFWFRKNIIKILRTISVLIGYIACSVLTVFLINRVIYWSRLEVNSSVAGGFGWLGIVSVPVWYVVVHMVFNYLYWLDYRVSGPLSVMDKPTAMHAGKRLLLESALINFTAFHLGEILIATVSWPNKPNPLDGLALPFYIPFIMLAGLIMTTIDNYLRQSQQIAERRHFLPMGKLGLGRPEKIFFINLVVTLILPILYIASSLIIFGP